MDNQRKVSATEFEAKCLNPNGKVTVEMLQALLEKTFHVQFQTSIDDQTDIYYDTASSERAPRFQLGGSGLSLRIRSIVGSDSYEMTAKRNISEIGGVFVREEVPINLPKIIDVDLLINSAKPVSPPLVLVRKYINDKLYPVLLVENHRVILSGKIEGSSLKVCHDSVTYSTFHENQHIKDFEIEIELKGLDSQLMERIVQAIRHRFPELSGQREDKYRRAIALLFGGLDYRTLSFVPPKFQRVTRKDVERCLNEAPDLYRPLFSKVIDASLPRLELKSQLSVLPMPSDVSLALWQERVVANLIETNPFLYDSSQVLSDSCFIAVDLPRSPLRFFEHTRAQHSLDVGYLAMVLAKKCGLNHIQVAYLGCAGIRHDVGHPALCHSGEVVAEEMGGQNHEIRTIEIVDLEDKDRLTQYDMTSSVLKNILDEQSIGQILGLADTLAYLIRDGDACEHPLPANVPKTIIEHFGFDLSTSMILFDDDLISAMQEMINFRFEMYRRVYYHPYSRIEEEMQQNAIRWAIGQGVITLEDLLEGDDLTLLDKMAKMAGHEPKLKQLVAGFFPDYCAVYHYRPHLTEEGVIDRQEYGRRLTEAGFNPLDFIISLPDTRASRKTLKGVRRDNGQTVEIRVQNARNFHPYDSRTIIAFAPHLRQEEILRTFISSR